MRNVTLSLIAMAMSIPAQAREGWEILAQRQSEFGENREVIRVGREMGEMKGFAVKSVKGRLVIYDAEIRFEGGERQRIEIDRRVGEDEQVMIADIPSRVVESITINYRARRNPTGKAPVMIVTGSSSGDRSLPRGWEVLETREYTGRDSEVSLPIGVGEGRIGAVRIRALDSAANIARMMVVFSDGESEEVRIGDRLAAGQMTEPIDLRGRPREIRSIRVALKAHGGDGTGRLQIIGRGGRGDWSDRDDSRGDRDGSYGRDRDRNRDRDDGPRGRHLTDRVPAGWVLFGTQTVSMGPERDVIRVGRQAGQFDQISLKVSDNDIFLRELTVVYANGERERREVRTELPAGSRTEPIRLNGDRFIDSIELVYQARPGRRGDATVEIYGEYAEGWVRDHDRRREHSQGWLLLGAQRVSSLTTDNDAFVIGERLGRFRALRIMARRNDVRILGIKITYRNGEVEELPVYAQLSEGQATEPIDLKGDARRIEKVDLRYRGRLSLKGSGVVELWGLH